MPNKKLVDRLAHEDGLQYAAFRGQLGKQRGFVRFK
jgi:hypothetical protein